MNNNRTVMQKSNEVVKMLEKFTFTDKVYRYPFIPVDKAKNACASYAYELDLEDILLLMDDSEYGDAQAGLIFSMKGIFAREPYKIRCAIKISEIKDLQLLNIRKLYNCGYVDFSYIFSVIDDNNINNFIKFIEEYNSICKINTDDNHSEQLQLCHIDELCKSAEIQIINLLKQKFIDNNRYIDLKKILQHIDTNAILKLLRIICDESAGNEISAEILFSFAKILIISSQSGPNNIVNKLKFNEGIKKLDMAIAKEIQNPSSIDILYNAMQARINNESDRDKKQTLIDTYISYFEIFCTKFKNEGSVFSNYYSFMHNLCHKDIIEDPQQQITYLNRCIDMIIAITHIYKGYPSFPFCQCSLSDTIQSIFYISSPKELAKDTVHRYMRIFRNLIKEYSDDYGLQREFSTFISEIVRKEYITDTSEIIAYLCETLQILTKCQKYEEHSFILFNHWRDTLYDLFHYERSMEGYRELLLNRAHDYAKAVNLEAKNEYEKTAERYREIFSDDAQAYAEKMNAEKINFEKNKTPVNEILGDFFYEFRVRECPDDEKYVRNLAALHYQKVVEADNKSAKAWFGWGRSLQAAATLESAGQKAALLSQAVDKYERAEQCGFSGKELWYPWAGSLYTLSEEAKTPAERHKFLNQAYNQYRKFYTEDSDIPSSDIYADFDYACCVFDLSEIEIDTDISKALRDTADPIIIAGLAERFNMSESILNNKAKNASNLAQRKWLLGFYLNKYEQKIFKSTKDTYSDSSLWADWDTWRKTLDSLLDIISNPEEKITLLENSIIKCKKTAESDSENEFAWKNWGQCLRRRINIEVEPGKKQKLIDDYLDISKKWHSYSALNPEMWIDWARKYFELARNNSSLEDKKRQLQESVAKYNRASTLKPDAVIEQNCGYIMTLLAYLETESRERTKLLEEAVLRYEKAAHVCLDSDSHQYHADWAESLLLLAEADDSAQREKDISAKAEEICEQALIRCPDFHKFIFGELDFGKLEKALGRICLRQAILARQHGRAEEAQQLFGAARGHFAKANESSKGISKGIADYDSACLELALGNEAECRRLLFHSLEQDTLPIVERIINDPLLASVRNTGWFAEFARSAESKGMVFGQPLTKWGDWTIRYDHQIQPLAHPSIHFPDWEK